MGSHYVYVNGICASRGLGRDRAMAAARDAVAARPDASVTVQRIRRDASPASTGETVAVLATGRDNATATPSDVEAADAYADAWRASDAATADVVAWSTVADAINDATAELAAARQRVAETRMASPYAYETAARVRDGVMDRAIETVRDAVDNAADGFEPDAVPVVVVPAARCDVAGLLQRAGVSCIRRGTPTDAGAAWVWSHNGEPARPAGNVADAVAYACGDRKPAPSRRLTARGRRSPLLPGETMAPAVPASHGAAAPTLPELRADVAAGRPVSLAAVARAVSNHGSR